MGKIVGFASDALGFGGGEMEDQISDAAELQADYEQNKLDYLKEREALPQQFREGALTQLGGLYGLEGGEGSQEELIARAKASPYYSEMIKEGEDAVLRNASSTGGMRSGNVQDALAKSSRGVLSSAYNQQLSGLQGLANLPSNTNQIANAIGGIGATRAQGEIAAAAARQEGNRAMINTAVELFGSFMGGGGGASFSDRRLKTNIEPKGQKKGFNWYSFTWNDLAKELFGLEGDEEGVIAQELVDISPGAIEEKDGYLTVDYEKLGVI